MAARSKSTFQKRQKEMKRHEKQLMKAERRAQKKLAARAEAALSSAAPSEFDALPVEPEPQN